MVRSPRVSLVIPVFNGANYVGEALASVAAQTRPIDEVVVVDDGSTDATLAVLAEYGEGIRVVRQDHRGPDAARNHGVAVATGDVLAFLDHDDLWEPTKTERQLAALELPGTEAVFGHVVQFSSAAPAADAVALPPGADIPAPGHLAPAMIVWRRCFEAVGPFAEVADGTGFIDWFARLIDGRFPTVMVPDVVLRRRLHPGNQSRHFEDPAVTYARAMRRVIDRRRSGAGPAPTGIVVPE